ncbi:glycoside hydrolase family 3 protein [Cohnella yongneupensis]|uniref:beta-N-acetylhexosaminidase n=1 Tax=Cohnella yongneupensis TaxID=425006 RepID=A0ABW0QWK4_9BACL
MLNSEGAMALLKIKLKELTVREKIGQTVVVLSNRAQERDKYGSLSAMMERYPVGGFFVGAEMIKDVMTGNTREQVREATRQYSEATRIPLLFASDFENGCGNMIAGTTKLPQPMALGATRSEQLAYDYGKATAMEAQQVGVNWTFSPVADLNMNRMNPITNIRALSDKPDWAIPLLRAFVRGMQEHRLAATAKHFPGDGVDYRDQHIMTTRNSLPWEEWLTNHGAMFQALIDDGVGSIMTGHIALPAYQLRTEQGGRHLPATLAEELTLKLLKHEMGFRGVVVSDALVMGGYLKWFPQDEAYVKSMQAGTDMMLWPEFSYFERMERALESGELSMERLEDAVLRILQLKQRLGLVELADDDQATDYSMVEAPEVSAEEAGLFAISTAKAVAERSLTLLNDENGLLPLSTRLIKNVLIVAICPADADFEEMDSLQAAFERRGVNAELKRNIWYEELQQREAEFDLIVFAPAVRPHRPMGPLGLSKDEASAAWSALTAGRDKTIVASFGSPYVMNDYFDMAPVRVNAYGNAPASHEAFVSAIFGEIPFAGQSPVSNL